MKLILAIIRIAKMNETKVALSAVDLPSFTAMPIIGRGAGRAIGPNIQATKNHPDLLASSAVLDMPRMKSKRMITLVVTDDKKDLAVETIIKVNQSGNSGDGKIIVIDAVDSIRVRTAESGDITLD